MMLHIIHNYFSLVLTSTAEQARDSSVELTIPSHSAESCAVIPTGDLRAVSTTGESEVFTEHLRHVVYESLSNGLVWVLMFGVSESTAEEKSKLLEKVLNDWRDRDK